MLDFILWHTLIIESSRLSQLQRLHIMCIALMCYIQGAIAKFQNTIIVNRIYGILNYFSHHWSLFLITVETVIWFNNINEYQLEPEWRIILILFVLDWQKQEDQAAKDSFSYKFKTSLVNKRLCHLGKRMTEEKPKGGLGEEQEEISTNQNLEKKGIHSKTNKQTKNHMP